MQKTDLILCQMYGNVKRTGCASIPMTTRQ